MREKDKVIVVVGEFDPLDIEELKFLRRCKAKGEDRKSTRLNSSH